ncbi:MAG TPA: NAD-dependent epimerase/dehydratase family protein [Devosia sp.]|nr:NAD-dependent epimerase/dehydratase family protein [Devosia sp.]
MGVFIFGLGYSAEAAARALHRLRDPDIPIFGTVREPVDTPTEALRRHLFDGTAPGATLGPDLARATHVIVSVPPDAEGDPVLRHHRADIAAAENLEWLGYFSTVGVYGDAGGAPVDEGAATDPTSARGLQRLEAEAEWREFAERRGVPLLILRLAGIYGPGRSAFDRLRDGSARRIVKPGQVFNRIHVEDIGRVTALAALARLEGTFNLADDEAAPPQDVIAHAAQLLGVTPPPEIAFEAAEMTPMARSFYADNKRVVNAAIKRVLGIELLYPTYREGLAAILANESVAA